MNSLVKDQLRLNPAGAAGFLAITTIPSFLGPVYGVLTDAFPLFGSRRRSYLVLSGVLGAGCWLALGALPAPAYAAALSLLCAGILAMAVATVVADALMVDVGKPSGKTGLLQSIEWSAANAASVVSTLCGGYLVERFSGAAAFRLYALFPLLAAGTCTVLLRGAPRAARSARWREVGAALRSAAGSRSQWAMILFLFAWFFSPALGTPLYYYQRDVLGFKPGFIGLLNAVFTASGILGAAFYARLSRRIPIRSLIGSAVALGTLGHLSYLAMGRPATAVVAYAMDGGLSLFAMLAVLDAGARVAPAQIEGTAFAMLTSARAAAALLGGVVGGKLYEAAGLQAVILVRALFTACCGLFVRWLPTSIPLARQPLAAVAQTSS
jgi:predicted MFS family arabinose efflux permease